MADEHERRAGVAAPCAEISPVNAPFASQWMFCTPTRMSGRSRSASTTAVSATPDGKKMTVPIRAARHSARGTTARNARASRRPVIHLPVGGEDGSCEHQRTCRRARRRPAASCPRGTRATRRRRSTRGSSRARVPPRATAAAESPPPTIVVAPRLVASAIASAIARVSLVERRRLEHTHRSVPEHGLRRGDRARVLTAALSGPMSNIASSAGIASRATACARCGAVQRGSDDRIVRQHQLRARRARAGPAPARRDRLRRATCPSRGPSPEERARHRAADRAGASTFGSSASMTSILPEIFDAAEDRDERPLRIRERAAEVVELLLHQEAGDGGPTDTAQRRRSMRARDAPTPNASFTYRSPSSRERARQRVVVLLLAAEKARVLEQQRLAGLRARCVAATASSVSVLSTNATGVSAAARASRVATGCERVLRLGLALGPAEVREQHDARAAIEQRSIVGSAARMRVSSVTCPAVVERHVEVDAHERALAAQVGVRQIANGRLVSRVQRFGSMARGAELCLTA